MAQNITLLGATYSAVPAVTLPKSGGGTARFTDVADTTAAASDVASGKYFYNANGERTQGTNSGGGGSTKNIQAYIGYAQRTANSYGATAVTLTVAKTGTYKISWCAARGSSSGTMGTNLHIGSSDGTNQQTWTGTYWQNIVLNNQQLTEGTTLTLYATSGSTTRSVYVGNLIIEEQ